jgi:hypothetical protein
MTWTLHGFGSLPWAEVQAVCAGMTCAWADYDGFQEGDCPTQRPPYSHVWGWSPGRFVRVRVDGEQGVVGLLTVNQAPAAPAHLGGSAATSGGTGRMAAEPVEVNVVTATNATAGVAAGTVLLRVIGPMPLTFVAGPPGTAVTH